MQDKSGANKTSNWEDYIQSGEWEESGNNQNTTCRRVWVWISTSTPTFTFSGVKDHFQYNYVFALFKKKRLKKGTF